MGKELIRLTYDKNVYELTFTRATVKQMEQAGFDLRALIDGSKAATMYELLFSGAFAARHRKIKRGLIEEIFEHLENKDKLIEALVEMFIDTRDTVLSSADEDESGKNASWEAI